MTGLSLVEEFLDASIGESCGGVLRKQRRGSSPLIRGECERKGSTRTNPEYSNHRRGCHDDPKQMVSIGKRHFLIGRYSLEPAKRYFHLPRATDSVADNSRCRRQLHLSSCGNEFSRYTVPEDYFQEFGELSLVLVHFCDPEFAGPEVLCSSRFAADNFKSK